MPIAIGVLDLDSSSDPVNDRQLIRAHAEHAGHTLAAIIEVDSTTYMPTSYTLDEMRRHAASVIITPTADHVWTARRAYTSQAQVIVCDPYRVWQRGHRWSPLEPHAATGSGRHG